MTREEEQYNKMLNTPVKRLVITLGIPTVISMLVTAIYNLADTYFVSRFSYLGSAAVSIVFPLMAIIQAIGFTFGMGGGSFISSLLGQRKEDEAQKVGSSSFYIAILIGLLITTFGLIFLKPLLYALGANDESISFTMDYGRYILIGAPFMTGSFVMNNLLRAEGKARFSMIGLTSGGILNMALDPLFIFGFNLGVAGAAIATLISQMVSFTILLMMFLLKKSIITLAIRKISFDFKIYFEIIKIGFPSLCRQGLASVATIFLNAKAQAFGGNEGVAAMGIVSKIFMVIFSASLGVGQGYQPVCGYNYFAKKYSRVKEAMLFTFVICEILLFATSAFFFVFAKNLMQAFNDNEIVQQIGMEALRMQCLSMPFTGINVLCNMTFQSQKKKFRATLLSCCRQGIFFIPTIFIAPAIFGLRGVEVTQSFAELLTGLFSVPFFISIIKSLNKLEKENA